MGKYVKVSTNKDISPAILKIWKAMNDTKLNFFLNKNCFTSAVFRTAKYSQEK